MSAARSLWEALSRKKTYTEDSIERTELSRSMNLFDLTLLGVGTSLGLGAYVLAGSVARTMAGPATVLSFLLAGIASVFAALCYAEFAGRIPRAGSAYVYSYVCVGEGIAFVIGWSMILEYLIGNATLARGIVGYLDTQSGSHVEKWMNRTMHMDVPHLAQYPDFLSFLLIAILSLVLMAGVKESAMVTNIFTILNLLTLTIVIIAGLFKVDVKNWNIPKSEIPEDANGGEGGFLPFGFNGVTAGAGSCFFGFVGFDTIAIAGEEAKNPQRNIPLAIIFSVSIVMIVYIAISTVLTMMWPYYLQNVEAPLPYVFEEVGWNAISWIVTIGAAAALIASMLGGMFCPPRIIYAMAYDGLLFTFLAKVNGKTQTPIVSIAVAGIISGFMAVIFEVQHLVEMLSIGTLLAYTIVAICVLMLRYEDSDMEANFTSPNPRGSCLRCCDLSLNVNRKDKPTMKTATLSKVIIWLFCLLAVILTTLATFIEGEFWNYCFMSVIGFIMILLLIVLGRQPNSTVHLNFKVPFVPVLPAMSVVINIYLMLQLQMATWIRLFGWMVVGIVLYLAYGLRASVEGQERRAPQK